ncbi:MAG: L,D-transpeptidase [Chlamydiota bacterium]
MSAPKWILVGTVTLFSMIGVAALFKKKDGGSLTVASAEEKTVARTETPIVSIPAKALQKELPQETKSATTPQAHLLGTQTVGASSLPRPVQLPKDDFPNIDRIFQLFSTSSSRLPIVETISYSSTVSWLKGRPAWVSDYAVHYGTSRHFIARSLNGRPDYFSQKVSEGSPFNVFRKDKKIEFFLLVDLSRCKMGFYYIDLDTNERVLLKTYKVGLGRLDSSSPSGSLTPLGRYALGDRVAIYQPGSTGYYQDQKVEMNKVFGTRWIPFGKELDRTTAPAKGYGLQGAPWSLDAASAKLVENRETIGAYDSDGCIRMSSEDIEELFSIVITKPTMIEIVKDFHEAKLPGIEVAVPSR